MMLNELYKSFIAVWGEDYANDLFDRGYEPVVVYTGSQFKLVWRLTNGDSCGTMESGRFYSRLNGSAD